jgi:hypothetical protein
MPSFKSPYAAVPSDEGDKALLRRYVDDPSSDGDDDDDDEQLGPARYPQDRPATKAGVTTSDGRSQPQRGSRRPWQQLCCGLQFSNTCLITAFLFGAAAVLFLGGGGLYIYHAAPKDGHSPPWYPTPRGGTVASWQKSYDKAKQMVERMTLVEKVNITTGTG